jgi:dipeptidyl aminopeptidase/acylaminoacyl peptidase
MKWLTKRFLLGSYVALVVLLMTVGCSLKEDPSEVLPLCGNHSCGDLAMVTTDTSSDGYHYLNPTMSPDGSKILFTADWKAIPVTPRYDQDEFYTSFRQLILIPTRESVDPATSLQDQGGILVRLNGDYATVWISGSSVGLSDIEAARRKGGPCWIDDSTICFYVETSRGYRLFTAYVAPMFNNPEYKAIPVIAYMEPEDGLISGGQWQHNSPSLSPDGRWLAFTRSGCALPDSFETCTGMNISVLDMSTIGADQGYGAVVHHVTNEYSRMETPRWSPDSSKLIFSGGMDVAGSSGTGTEIFTIDFDTTGASTGELVIDNNLQRLTYTSYMDGDPIAGILNSSPSYTPDGSEVVFVSTRRAPSITLHDRNIWKIPSDGRLDPSILYFTRSDDVDPEVQVDGSILMSSQLGFPTEILDQLEREAYEALVEENEDGSMSEIEMRNGAAAVRNQLSFFEGVMSLLYIYRP